jgi:hypothetical protein
MALVPGNPVVGGTVLRRAAITSPQFNIANPAASPTPSWGILQSGVAWFFGLILSGGTIEGPDYLINTAGAFFYSGAPALGNLIASVASTGGTDGFGNAYQAGITSYSGTTFAQLFASTLNFMIAGDTTQAQVSGGGGGLALNSGASVAGRAMAALQLLQSLVAADAPRAVLGSNSSVAALLGFAQGFTAPTAAAVDRPSLTWLPGVGHLSEIDKDDGNTYALGHFTAFSTTDQPISNLTFSTVCGSAGLAPGKYRVRAVLMCQQGPNAVADDFRLGFTGTISQVRMNASFNSTTAGGQLVFTSTTTSNNGLLASAAFAAAAIYKAEFDGIIVATSTGTLSVQAAMSGAGDTFTVLALSFFHLERID